jgi:hypothetical protein
VDTEFRVDQKSKDGLSHWCKACAGAYGKVYYSKNKGKIAVKHKQWIEENREKVTEYTNERRRLKKLTGECTWCTGPALPGISFCDKHRILNNKRTTFRNAHNLVYRLKRNLRSRLRHALKNGAKRGSAVRDLGCTGEELKAYLEARFQPGMTWGNYGNGVSKWTIDHIKPLSVFDLTDRDQLLRACHFTNLQPMWFVENIKKGDGV